MVREPIESRLDNSELTLKVADLESRISSLEEEGSGRRSSKRIGTLEKRLEALEELAGEIKKSQSHR